MDDATEYAPILWRLLFAMLLAGLALAVADILIITLCVLLLVFAGVLFGIFLNGLSSWLAGKTPLSYLWAYCVVVTVLVLLIGGGFYYLGSQAAKQAGALWSELQSAVQQLEQRVQQYEWVQQYLGDKQSLQEALAGGSLAPNVMKGLRWIGWAVTGLLVIGFVGLYVAYDPDLYKTGLVKLVPQKKRPRATEVLHTLHDALGDWIVGRLISMAIVGVVTAIGLSLLGVPLPVSLGVLAALLTFIPNIGPVLAAVPQTLLALQVSTSTALYVIIFNIAMQTVESYLITPMVQRYEVTLPPALTICAQLLMGVVIGIVGVMMAAPLTVVIMALVQLLYIRDRLGDSSPGELTENL